MKIAIGLGSNIEPEKNILEAILLLSQNYAVSGFSTFYHTPAVGITTKNAFINGVVQIETGRSAPIIQQELREIAFELGRGHDSEVFTDKTIDLTLLLYGEQLIQLPELTVPSPYLTEWAFYPLCVSEIDPEWKIPPERKTIIEQVPVGLHLVPADVINQYLEEQLWT